MVRRSPCHVRGGDMKQIRFTDLARQPKGGYRKAAETDITIGFKRARQEHQRNEAERAAKVATLKRSAK